MELCQVCTAKAAGRAPPKRKCTCDAGLTQHRNHIDRFAEIEGRLEDVWAAPGLVNKEDRFDECNGHALCKGPHDGTILSGTDGCTCTFCRFEDMLACLEYRFANGHGVTDILWVPNDN